MWKNVGPSYSSIEVLHIQDAMKIIQEQRELGFDTPLYIKVVIKVKKMLDYKHVRKGFDQDEKLSKNVKLLGFMLLMDGDGVVAIICYKAILEKEATKYGDKALWLFQNGGYVERSKLKKSSLITMFGWRWAQKFCK
jgi:hypothetical protein